MAYVSKEDAKTKREAIKRAFPAKEGWKFSLTVQNYSKISFSILKAPYDMLEKEDKESERGCVSINYHHIRDKFKGRKMKDLLTMYKILNKGNYNNSDSMRDYFDVGFYLDMYIGRYDRDFSVS